VDAHFAPVKTYLRDVGRKLGGGKGWETIVLTPDEKLVARLVKEGTALTVCPLSNLKLCVVRDMKHHPLRKMLDLGLKATINSDDPAYFGGYVNQNYLAVADALGLGREEIAAIVRNGFRASLMSTPDKDRALAEVAAVLAESE